MTDPGESADTAETPKPDRRLAALSATVLALPIALLAGIGAFAYLGGFSDKTGTGAAAPSAAATGPVTVQAPPSSLAADPLCARLLNGLPRILAGAPARPVSDAPNRVAAWGDPAIVLSCGVAKPPGAGAAAQEFVINGVAWVYGTDGRTAVWTTNKRAVYVEVRIPPPYQEAASQRIINPLAAPIKAAIPPGK